MLRRKINDAKHLYADQIVRRVMLCDLRARLPGAERCAEVDRDLVCGHTCACQGLGAQNSPDPNVQRSEGLQCWVTAHAEKLRHGVARMPCFHAK